MSPEDIWSEHAERLAAMREEDRLVVAREVIAAIVRTIGYKRGEPVTRLSSLEQVFLQEAQARAAEIAPWTDIFLPLDRDLPMDQIIERFAGA